MIIARYQEILKQIDESCQQVGRNSKNVKLVAVSKRQELEKINQLLASDDTITLGENYVQEFAEKKADLIGSYEAHFIGPLQSNKAKKAVELFDVIQSVDSLKLFGKINKAAENLNKKQKVFIQVNISEDTNKSGFLAEDLKQQLDDIIAHAAIDVLGLMTITRYYSKREDVLPDFQKMNELRVDLQQDLGVKLLLSMGMSADYDLAIKAGSDLVRVGTAIFGARS